MLFRSKPVEIGATVLGAVVLATISGLLSRPIEQVPENLHNFLQPASVQTLHGIFSIILLYGLGVGMIRHRDPSPLLFALLGIGVFSLLSYNNLPSFLPLLCSACFAIAGLWSIFITSHNTEVSKTPRLDEFLEKSLLTAKKEHDKA